MMMCNTFFRPLRHVRSMPQQHCNMQARSSGSATSTSRESHQTTTRRTHDERPNTPSTFCACSAICVGFSPFAERAAAIKAVRFSGIGVLSSEQSSNHNLSSSSYPSDQSNSSIVQTQAATHSVHQQQRAHLHQQQPQTDNSQHTTNQRRKC